jgi:hypothetical protein
MTDLWREWSYEDIKVSKKSVVSTFRLADVIDHTNELKDYMYRIRLKHIKGDTFKIKANKGLDTLEEYLPTDEPLTKKEIEGIEEFVRGHLKRPSIFLVNNPNLIWE